MENAILISKFAAVVYLAIGLGTLINPSSMKKLLDDFIKSPGLTFLAAWITTIVGMIIIFSYNVWTRHRGLLVTIIGRIATIKGLSLFILPNNLMKMSINIAKKSRLITIFSFILGLVFLYIGFIK
ncbi:MAG: hypothetical protein PHR61_05060 [Candidatus Absconditabacteria bacterium]|nr:hypothetical protein [Candidatus Absconditabacteria bacterium]